MKRIEYDFFKWTSFPSSIALKNDESVGWAVHTVIMNLSIEPGAMLTARVKTAQKDVTFNRSHLVIDGWDGSRWVRLPSAIDLPWGTYDWRELEGRGEIPRNVKVIRIVLTGGGGRPIGITWFDDLKIYQDDKLIYENKFSNWLPYQIAGAIALSIPTALYAIPRLKRR